MDSFTYPHPTSFFHRWTNTDYSVRNNLLLSFVQYLAAIIKQQLYIDMFSRQRVENSDLHFSQTATNTFMPYCWDLNTVQEQTISISQASNSYTYSMEKEIIDQFQMLVAAEDIVMGEDLSYVKYFLRLRQHENYEKIFFSLSNSDFQVKKAIIYLLSELPFQSVKFFEESFIEDIIKNSNDTSLQEFALNTLSLWNDKAYTSKFKNVNLKNHFLKIILNRIVCYNEGKR